MADIRIYHNDCKTQMRELVALGLQVDSIVTDPPYELGFMNKHWDSTGIAYDREVWELCLKLLKPGGHLLAFGGSRTYHRLASAIEDAGFEIRDQIQWVYGSGFPKSMDISKAIDKMAGAEREILGQYPTSFRPLGENSNEGWIRPSHYTKGNITAPATEAAKQWQGWGTQLKPAHEPIVLARAPLSARSIAENVIKHGVGGINIDGCRVAPTGERLGGGGEWKESFTNKQGHPGWQRPWMNDEQKAENQAQKVRMNVEKASALGRFPANLIHDGSDEVNGAFSNAARFFYSAKASQKERNGSTHPTVKPLSLMRYLCRLITPPGGIVLDPFAGTGTTGQAALEEGFNAILIEREEQYVRDAQRRHLP